MKHRLLAVLLVMSLVSASVPVAAAEGQVIGRPSLSLSVPDNRVAPGETVSLDVFGAPVDEIKLEWYELSIEELTGRRAAHGSSDKPLTEQ